MSQRLQGGDFFCTPKVASDGFVAVFMLQNELLNYTNGNPDDTHYSLFPLFFLQWESFQEPVWQTDIAKKDSTPHPIYKW